MPSHPKRPSLVAAVLAIALALSACGTGVGGSVLDPLGAPPTTQITAPSTSTTAPPTDSTGPTGGGDATRDPAIDQRLRGFVSWDPPVHVSTDERAIAARNHRTGGFDVSCSVTGSRELAPAPFDDFTAFVFDGSLVPGLIVEGEGVLDGDLRPVPLQRAPLTLAMDLASANPTRAVDDPTSAALTEAIAALKADADARLTGIDVVPAQVDFLLEESSSYEEALLQLGISARYDSPGLRAGFSSSFDQREATTEHSVTMRLLQPMFTVSVDRSSTTGPGDLVAASADVASVERLVAGGVIGETNTPLLIDRVTYGRSVYLTISSTEVDDARDLKVAVDAAYGGFSGDAEVADRHRRIVNESSIQVRAFGGDQEVALAALRSGEIRDFLRSVNTSNAIPLTFGLRTLDGALVAVTDRGTVQDIGCERTPVPVARTRWAVEAYSGGAWIDLFVNSTKVATIERNSRTTTVDLTPYMDEGRSNELRVHVWPDTCLTNPSVGITITADGVQKSRRIQDGMTCDWWSTWTLDDADDTVRHPDNWTTG
jgi:hypothetical protein